MHRVDFVLLPKESKQKEKVLSLFRVDVKPYQVSALKILIYALHTHLDFFVLN